MTTTKMKYTTTFVVGGKPYEEEHADDMKAYKHWKALQADGVEATLKASKVA